MIRMFQNTIIESMHSNSKLFIKLGDENAIIQTENINGDEKKNLMVEYIDYKNGQTIQKMIPFYENIRQKKVDDKSRSCKVCGCTQERACPGGCHWVTDDLCSNCVFSILTCDATVSPNESLEPIDGTFAYLADEITSEEICEGYVAGHAAALGLSSEAEDTALQVGDRVRVYAVYQHSEIIKQFNYFLEPKKE